MSSDGLWFAVAISNFAFVITFIIAAEQRWRRVPGSYGRYVASTVYMAACVGVIVCGLLMAAISLTQGHLVAALLNLALACVYAKFLINASNDDNWFNDQWKRLKRGAAKLRQGMANHTSLPQPSSA